MNFNIKQSTEELCVSMLNKYEDIESLLDFFLKGVYATFGYDRIAVFVTKEEENRRFYLRKMIYRGDILEGEEEISFIGKPGFLSPLVKGEKDYVYTEDPFLGLYMPLEKNGEVVGMVRAEKTESKYIDKENVSFLKKVVDRLSEEMHKYYLNNTLIRQNKMLGIYQRLSEILVSTLKTEEIIRDIIKAIQKNFLFDDIKIYLYDKADKKLYGAMEGDFRFKINNIEDEIYDLTAAGLPMLADVIKNKNQRVNVWENILADIALQAKKEIIGVLRVHNLLSRNEITDTEIDFLKSFTSQIGVAIRNTIDFGEVRTMANTDSLTGVNTKRYFIEELVKEISRATRFKQYFAIIVIDIDKFKEVNDKYGHPEGDKLLRNLASLLKENIRDIDIVCRYGGDEFVVYLANTDSEEASRYIDRILSLLKKENRLKISAGISIFPEHGRDFDELFKKADIAMYASKKAGHNNVTVHGKKK